MLDERSLEVISRLKDTLNSSSRNSSPGTGPGIRSKHAKHGTAANRGSKLISAPMSALINDHVLVPKVVEYESTKRLVLTNESIERNNFKRRRKWRETYGDPSQVTRTILGEDGEEVNADNQVVTTANGNGRTANGHGRHHEESDDGALSSDPEDEDNDEDDEEDEEDDSDSDLNPFKKINLAEILSPLTHPSEIISHPAISKTYKSQIFGKLAYELIELIELEQENLNWLNKLLQVLNGEDWFYLLEENLGLPKYDHGLNQNSDDETPNASVIESDDSKKTEGKEKVAEEASTAEKDSERDERKDDEKIKAELTAIESSEPTNDSKRITRTSSIHEDKEKVSDPFFGLPDALKKYETIQRQQFEESSNQDDLVKEELVNYLQVSIQRQQEYIKNLTQIRNGLVRADRLKQDLLKWGKEMYEKKSS